MPQPNAFLVRVARYRSTFLGALLVVALAVTGVVTVQAYRASRNYKKIVERVLHDYIATAAYQYSQNVTIAVNACNHAFFVSLTDPAIGVMAASDVAQCQNQSRDYFEYDYVSQRFSFQGKPLPAEVQKQIRTKAFRPDLAYFRHDWYDAVIASNELAADEYIAYVIKLNAAHQPVRLVGVVAKGVQDMIAPGVLRQTPLLSPELAGGVANEYWHGQVLTPKQADREPEPFASRTKLVAPYEDLAVEVELKPSGLAAVVPNGQIPRDNGGLFFGLFSLALGLVTSAILLLRRESQLAHARASFVSSVSHELRTPLAQIRMFAEMLLLGRARTEQDQRRSIEIIDNEAKRLSHLVENVLQAARSERGAIHINPTDTKLAPVIRDAAESFMALSEQRRIDFRLELQEELNVSVDADAVRHIVLNLLDNAAKYGPVGQRIVIGLALFNDSARLWVDDEGPGIPQRERERVFQAFYRSQRDLHSATAGSGIGLAIVRELAGLHGGSAWIEDAPERGARVVVEFPGAYVAEQQSTDWAVA